jgi:Zn-dependent peptidase ImmA (M78 family)
MPLPHFKRTFAGAMQLAHWLKNNHFGIGTTNASNITPGLLDAVAAETGQTIEIHLRSELKTVSVCLKRGTKTCILIPKASNFCHRRYAMCKELCHVLTDDPSENANNPSEQLELAIRGSQSIRELDNRLFFRSLGSEDFCMMLAVEMMLPESTRDDLTIALTSRQEPAFDVAYRLRIPEAFIKFYRDSIYSDVWKLFKTWN